MTSPTTAGNSSARKRGEFVVILPMIPHQDITAPDRFRALAFYRLVAPVPVSWNAMPPAGTSNPPSTITADPVTNDA